MRSLLVIPDSVATRGGLRLATLVPCALLVVSLSGCWNSTDNSVADATTAHVDDDVAVTEADVDMPADFAAAVDRIKDYRRGYSRPLRPALHTMLIARWMRWISLLES